ncbi:hypothetical protein PR048_017810 [Dryococelus australis]|uniref:Uncharacterized protein n=1 Tax=Dryococelus australis TaxID=614101 RepID=A0ABQ9HAM7_9NEOP|nr:hypothetical protein PR048_017810 [Dryococelus australis]
MKDMSLVRWRGFSKAHDSLAKRGELGVHGIGSTARMHDLGNSIPLKMNYVLEVKETHRRNTGGKFQVNLLIFAVRIVRPPFTLLQCGDRAWRGRHDRTVTTPQTKEMDCQPDLHERVYSSRGRGCCYLGKKACKLNRGAADSRRLKRDSPIPFLLFSHFSPPLLRQTFGLRNGIRRAMGTNDKVKYATGKGAWKVGTTMRERICTNGSRHWSHRYYTQCDENTAHRFRAVRLAAMAHLTCVTLSPLWLPCFAAQSAGKKAPVQLASLNLRSPHGHTPHSLATAPPPVGPMFTQT